MPIKVEIVTQERVLYEGEAEMVIVPGSEGEMGILPHHAPLLSTLGYGELRIKTKAGEEYFAIFGGVVEVQPDRVTILADTAERSDEIDLSRAEAARERAAKMLEKGPPADPGDAAAFEASLKRAEMRLKVAKHRRGQARPGSVSIRTEE
ncbi:MAG: F0F1 ATP synthase subunit epsilon [Anaerolineae bacterium]